MDHFTYRDGSLFADRVGVRRIAQATGTPVFVYSRNTIREHYSRLHEAFAPLGAQLYYAVKANSNIHILRELVSLGAGMDVVSGGELERAWAAGCPMDRVVFAGVGKSEVDLLAALSGRHSLLGDSWQDLGLPDPSERGPVGFVNVESESELELLSELADRVGVRARVAVRLNPDIDANTHTFTTTGRRTDKFGVDAEVALELFRRFAGSRSVEMVGLHAHLGSPIYDTAPFVAGARALTQLADRIGDSTGARVTHLDLGGGIGADYHTGQTPLFTEYAKAVEPILADRVRDGLQIGLEPGRSIMGNAGVLVTRVEHVKPGANAAVVVCDAGMNCLVRPSLYGAFHFAWPTDPGERFVPSERSETPLVVGAVGDAVGSPDGLVQTDLVGPICETTDFLARARLMPPVQRGDLMAIFTAGAYGMSMANTYNDHPLPAEVLVDSDTWSVIRERQRYAALLEPTLPAVLSELQMPCEQLLQ